MYIYWLRLRRKREEKITDTEIFAQKLTELIWNNLTTITEAGREIGCGEPALSRYASGKALPSVDTAVRIADYFGVTVDYLFGLEESFTATRFKTCPPFASRLEEVLSQYKISRYRLEKMTGISDSVMRYWVRGKTAPSLESVVKIAQALDCSVDYLLGRA